MPPGALRLSPEPQNLNGFIIIIIFFFWGGVALSSDCVQQEFLTRMRVEGLGSWTPSANTKAFITRIGLLHKRVPL